MSCSSTGRTRPGTPKLRNVQIACLEPVKCNWTHRSAILSSSQRILLSHFQLQQERIWLYISASIYFEWYVDHNADANIHSWGESRLPWIVYGSTRWQLHFNFSSAECVDFCASLLEFPWHELFQFPFIGFQNLPSCKMSDTHATAKWYLSGYFFWTCI